MMDVSSLGIEVKSSGIKEASSALSGLGTSAANAETKVSKLTDAVERLLKLNVTATMQAWTASMNAMSNAMNSVGSGATGYAMALANTSNAAQQASTVTNTLNQQFNNQASVLVNLTNTVNNYASATARAAQSSEGWTARSGVMLNTLKAMTTAFLYYQSIHLAKSVVEAADEYTNLNAKMVVATKSQQNANIAMQDSFAISQQLRTSYASTAELMARMQIIMSRTGNDYATVKTTVTGLAAALHLYGATTGESSSAMLAYAHSASTGVVHMRTLNSLMTSAPLLLQAFQDATGKSGEELRKMSTKGQLTFEMLNKALQDATPRFLEQFDKIPLTFGGAMQRLENSWLHAIGMMGQDTGFNTSLGEALKIIENMIPAIAQGLGNAFVAVIKWIDQNKEHLAQIGGELWGLITDVVQIGEDFAGWLAEITGASDGLSVVASAIYGIRLLLAYVTDAFKVIGIAVTLIGGAIGLFISTPLSLVVSGLGLLIEGFGKVLSMSSALYAAQGNLVMAQVYREQADSASALGESLSMTTKKTAEASMAALDLGKKWADAFDRGETSVEKLLNSTEDAKKALANMPMDYGTGNGWDAPKFQEDAADLARKKAAAEKAAAEAAGAKAAAAAVKEVNKQLEAVARLTTEYEKLKATTEELNMGSAGVKVGPAQTEFLRIQNEIIATKGKEGLLNEAQIVSDLQKLEVQANVNANIEKYNELLQKSEASGKKGIDQETALTAVLKTQLETLEKRNAAFRNPSGKQDLTGAKADDIQRKLTDAQNSLNTPIEGMTNADVEHQQALIKGYQEHLDLLKQIVIEQRIASQNSLTTEWDKMFDDKKTTKFTNSMVAGMGQIGKAIAGASNAMRTLNENQDKVNKAMQIAKDTAPGPLQDKRQIDAASFALQMQMDNYANLSQAAQGFFGKNTEGYKIMGAAEKAFRVTEMAMAIENYVVKSGILDSEVVMTLVADAKKVGSAILSSFGIVAAEDPKQVAFGVSALAASLTIPPPASFASFAATAALLLAIGIGVAAVGSHGSSGTSAAQQQAVQGTGTILGDSTKQSQSIDDSLKALKSNSNISLKYSSQMVMSLVNIEAALTGVTNAIISGNGAITGANFQSKNTGFSTFVANGLGSAHGSNPLAGIITSLTNILNNITGGILGKLLGVSTKSSLVDSGISSGNQTIGSVLSGGFQGNSYQTVDTKSEALWGLVSHSSTSTDKAKLDPAISSAFTDVIKGMVSTVTAAAAALGQNASAVAKQLDSVTVSLGNISLKGLTADQITKQLNAVFSAFGDKLVTAALGPLLTGFQQAGEGLLQTAVRVASGVDEANGELAKLGLTAINFSQVVNKSGDVASEIVRQTILLKQAGTSLGDIISTMSDTAVNIGDTYISLLTARRSLQALGIAKDVTTDLLAAAGGLSALQSSLDSYQKNFFTAAQQSAMTTQELTQQFADIGVTMPKTKAAFVALVNQLTASGTSGQALAAKVIGLSDAFNNLYSTVDTAVANATSNLTTAYNNQVSVINAVKTAFDGFATSLKTFKNNLATGALSTNNDVQKYQAQKSLYDQTSLAASKGDQTAIGQFETVATAFLTASRTVNASGDQYTADYQKVLAQTEALQQFSAGQASVQDQQLSALDKQVQGLITINSSVLTVAQAIQALQAAIATGISTPSIVDPTGGKKTVMPVGPTPNGSHAAGLGMVPFDGYLAQLHKGERVLTATAARSYDQNSGSSNAEMVAELKSLKATVASLRDGQREQTGAIISATYDSNAQNAEAIVEGQKDAAKDALYNQHAKGTLA